MAEDSRLSKVEILIHQNKFAEAEKILANLLSQDSNNIYYLNLLAEVNLQQGKFDIAKNFINKAIGIYPNGDNLFFTKAKIAIQQDDFAEAEKCIAEAISIYPEDVHYFALSANIKLALKQYQEALDIANQALQIDAENVIALNARSTALIKLNRKEESFQTIEGALREDPNNAYTHTNYAWGLLEKGDHKKALEHFKEALSNDPTFEFAQTGMLEALKATNPIYRLFLKYSFFMSNLTAKYQWGVLIGFYLGFKALRTLANNNAALQPYLIPIIIVFALLAFSTWVIEPISNLFLRFNKYGQILLSEKEKMSSNLVAVSLGLFLVSLLLYFALADEKMLSIAFYGFAMMLPLGMMFSPSKNKNALLIYTIALAVVGLLAIGLTFSTGEMFNFMTIVFIFGFVGFQWLANYMIIRENNF